MSPLNRTAATAMVLLLAAGLRFGAIAPKRTYEHDDAMTYVASSGREYSEWESLQGRWVPASSWKALVDPLPGPRLLEIEHHIADSEIVHPPLYFWLLHSWSLAFGTGLVAGPALNVLLAGLTLLVLHRLGLVLFGSREAALFAVALWAASPGTLGVSPLVRPYELLQLLGCVLALGVARVRTDGRGAGLILAASAAGMLTHYEFAFLVVAAAGMLAMPGAAVPRSAFRGLVALAVGASSTLLVNPGFLLPFVAQAGTTKTESGRIGERLLSPDLPTLRLLDHSFLAGPWKEPWSAGLGVACGVALALALAGASRAYRSSRAERPRPAGPLLAAAFFAAVFFGHGAAWVLGLVPLHASTSRYLSPAYPFLALILVAAARGFGTRGSRALLASFACLELAGSGLLLASLGQQRGWAVPEPLATAERVLADHTGTGVLPRIVAHVPDSALVFADMQEGLLRRPDAWRRDLWASRRAAWASVHLFYDTNGDASRLAVRRLVEEQADVGETEPSPLIGGEVSAIRARSYGTRR